MEKDKVLLIVVLLFGFCCVQVKCYESFIINQNTTLDQRYSHILKLNNGNAFIIWENSANFALYGRIVSSNGSAITNQFKINEDSDANLESSLALLHTGNVFVTWKKYQNPRSYIYGRFFSFLDGTPISDSFMINDNTTEMQQPYEPRVVTMQNGNLMVIWTQAVQPMNFSSFVNVMYKIIGPSVTNNGANDDTVISITNEAVFNQNASVVGSSVHQITKLENSNILVCWRGAYSNPPEKSYTFCRIKNFLGIDADEFIMSNITGSSTSSSVSLDNQNVFIVYDGTLEDGGSYIVAKIYDSYGVPLTEQFTIDGPNGQNIRYQSNPSISKLLDGNVLITWNLFEPNENNFVFNIYGCIFSATTGKNLSSVFLISDVPSTQNFRQSHITFDNGHVLAIWDGADIQINTYDVYGRIFTESFSSYFSSLSSYSTTSRDITSSKITTHEVTPSQTTTHGLTTNSINMENSECVDSSDCEDQGICVDNGYCSCYSGFGGLKCVDKPSLTCSNEYSDIDANIAKFKPEIGVFFENSIVKMIVRAPLESTMFENPSEDHSLIASNQIHSLDTLIKFVGNVNTNNGDDNECNYPSGFIENEYKWIKSAARDDDENSTNSCFDIYNFNIPWNVFRSRCDVQTLGDNIFGHAVEISRSYAIPFSSTFIIRTESLQRNIEFRFPDSVDISTNVSAIAPSNLSVSAVLSVKYNIQTNSWTIIIITNTIRPFRLTSPSVASDNTTTSRIKSVSIIQSQQSSTRQNVVIEIDSCYPISAVLTTTLVTECYIPSECSTSNDSRFVTLVSTINTGNACPLVHTIALSTSSLLSFSNISLTQPQSSFPSNSRAYFTANIDSDEATITSKHLESVCISLNSGTCNSLVFTTINTQSDNPSFSISLSSLNGLAQDGDIVTVKVKVGIEWQDTNKRRSIQSFNVALNTQFIINNKNEGDSIINNTQPAINSGVFNGMSITVVLVSLLFCLV